MCLLIDHSEALADEAGIRWANDAHPELYPFVRESVITLTTRGRRPGRGRHPGRLVAWAVLGPSARSSIDRCFQRRVWWVRHDESAYAGGGSPAEGVDPCSIRPGQESRPPRPA